MKQSDMLLKIYIRGYQKLAAAIIVDAIKNIRKKIIIYEKYIRPDADIVWLHRKGSSFEFFCELAGVEPEPIRKQFPLSLKRSFKIKSVRGKHAKRID